MKTELWLSLKYLKKHKRTPAFFISIIALLGIAVGVAALILVISVMSGFDKEVKDKLLSFNYHIVGYSDEGQMTQEGIDIIRSYSDVENAVKIVEFQTGLIYDKKISPAMIYAVDFNEKETEHWNRFLIKGDYSGLILGRLLMGKLGAKIGDEIEIVNPFALKDEKFRTEKVKISGVFEVGLYDADDMAAVMPLGISEKMKTALEKNVSLGVRMKNPDGANSLKADFFALREYGFRYFYTWIDRNATLFTWLKLEKIGSYLILSLIILVASFNIFATQSIRVVEKTKDIAILKSMGFSKFNIAFMFCFQGMFIGIFGTAFGLLLGMILCYVVGYTDLIPLPAELYHINHIPVLFDYFDVGAICSIALVLTFVFSLFPAIKAASLKEVEALGYE